MITKAIDRILELSKPNIVEYSDGDFSDKELYRINTERRASAIRMTTLTGLVDYIKGTKDFKACDYIVHVISPTRVVLISELDSERGRETLVDVEADIPDFPFGRKIGHEEFIIGVQAKFVDDDSTDKALILKFAGTVKSGSVTEYSDDGITQKATVKQGVATMTEAVVPSPCRLAPYRTFSEVKQPTSSFIFRLDDKTGEVTCALHEADGGAWRNEAMTNIAKFLSEKLATMSNIKVLC